MNKNYFEIVNQNYWNEDFKLKNRVDPDMYCEELIKDLVGNFILAKSLPSGKLFTNKEQIAQTNDTSHSLYAEVQVFENKKRFATFRVTPDYIGASIYWAMKAGVADEEIKNHLKTSRLLAGHLLFPKWIATPSPYKVIRWSDDPKGTINTARGGVKGYYDRIDYTLFALKNWYEEKQSKLFDMIEKYEKWFNLFENFSNYIEFFKLKSLLKGNNIVDLTSYDKDNDTYNNVIENDSHVSIPSDRDSYINYMYGCERFIKLRQKEIFAQEKIS